MSETITALDLFAGTGWGVACQRLGIREMGVEIMPEAIATRDANGMATIYRDVWDGLEGKFHVPNYQLLIASPPCQTFSLAGKGSGRAALNEVLEAIELHAYKDPTQLREFGEKHDPRTALVLAPLAHVWRDRPEYVAFEQVPTVLPVWEACADVMREWGYSVDVAALNAEQYGVPQTRKRAILVGRLNGEAKLPTPTHSRYYPRTPEKVDAGVLPWVSMAEALGWGATDQPSHTITGGTHGPTDRWASGGNSVRKALDGKIGTEVWIDKPDQAVDNRTTYAQRFDVADVAALQTYPTTPARFADLMHHVPEGGNWRNLPANLVQEAMGGAYNSGGGKVGYYRRLHRDRPSPTIVGSPTQKSTLLWHPTENRPISVEEASAIQTYEPPFIWCGSKTKQFLQIGNAVPPLLAQAVLSALVEREA